MVGLPNKGISKPADLKGKKIGLPLGTISEFYLGRFLNLNGMNVSDVTIINLPVTQDVTALANGSVDAVVVTRERTKVRFGHNIRMERSPGRSKAARLLMMF